MDRTVTKKINRQALIFVSALAVLSWLISGNKLVAFNVIIGGFISWLSIKELSWAVKKFFGKPVFQLAVVGLSYLKLGMIFVFLWFIAMHGWFNIFGLLTGFLVILIISVKEAYLHTRRQSF